MAVTRIPVDRGCSIYSRSGTWWVYLRQAGKTVRKSLETRDRQHALTVARELASAAVSGRWNVTASSVSLKTVADRYSKEESAVHHSAATQKLLKYFFDDFMPWCEARNIRTLEELRREHVEAFLIRNPKWSPATANRSLAWLRRFCRWAHGHGLSRVCVTDGVRALRVPTKVRYTLTPEQIQNVAAHCSDTMKDLCFLITNTGLRVSEALDVRKADFDPKAKTLLVRSPKVHSERVIPLNAVALGIVARRSMSAEKSGLLFATWNDKPISRNNVARAFRVAAGHAGVKDCSPHALRRSFGTFCAKSLTTGVLKNLMGHSSISTTMKHYVGAAVVCEAPPVVAVATG